MEMVAGVDTSITKAKEALKIKRKLTAAEWIKIIDKNPEAFKISRAHITETNTKVRKANVAYEKDFNSDNTMKSGRPKSEKTDEIFNFINDKLNSDWIQIKALKTELMAKFGITAGKVESEYTKYSELNGDFIIREYIKPNGWCIKAKGKVENDGVITAENIPDEIEEKKEQPKMQNEDDAWV